LWHFPADFLRYFSIYLPCCWKATAVWGKREHTAVNDFIAHLYPQEWARMQAIRDKYRRPKA
jgi:hypothetical protein